MKTKRILSLVLLYVAAFMSGIAHAESNDEKTLSLDVDAKLFLVNNEFSTFQRGYTLPGFRLTPTIAYKPTSRIKLEAGAYMLHYWGANKYPNTNYLFIPYYSEKDCSQGLHALPFLRAEASTPFGLKFVAGNIYGQEHHKLLPQLYAPELALTADPEAGFQILYNCRWLDLDAWIDWRKFIFNDSPSRENFFVGLSSKVRYNSSESRVHVYTPLQLLIEHRGGEIDTNVEPGINTLLNAAIGLGVRFDTGLNSVRSVQVEGDAMVSKQVAGHAWVFENGWSALCHADVDLWGVTATLGYYYAHNFQTLLGLPMWGAVSADGKLILKNPSTGYVGISYKYEFAKGFSLSANAEMYRLFDSHSWTEEKWHPCKGATNYVMGVTFTACPSFLLKSWK